MTIRDDLEHIFANTWTKGMFELKLREFLAREDHTFTMIESPLSVDQMWLYGHMNCFAHSLGLHRLAAYGEWVRRHEQNLFDELSVLSGRFFCALIDQGLLAEVSGADVPLHSLVVYCRADRITHCGTILDRDKRVRSKFSVNEFYEHGLMEVQTSFGLPIKYLKPPTYNERRKIMAQLARLPPVTADTFRRSR